MKLTQLHEAKYATGAVKNPEAYLRDQLINAIVNSTPLETGIVNREDDNYWFTTNTRGQAVWSWRNRHGPAQTLAKKLGILDRLRDPNNDEYYILNRKLEKITNRALNSKEVKQYKKQIVQQTKRTDEYKEKLEQELRWANQKIEAWERARDNLQRQLDEL